MITSRTKVSPRCNTRNGPKARHDVPTLGDISPNYNGSAERRSDQLRGRPANRQEMVTSPLSVSNTYNNKHSVSDLEGAAHAGEVQQPGGHPVEHQERQTSEQAGDGVRYDLPPPTLAVAVHYL